MGFFKSPNYYFNETGGIRVREYIKNKIIDTKLYRCLLDRNKNLDEQLLKLQEENKDLKTKVNHFYESRSAIETKISVVKTENKELNKWLDYHERLRKQLEIEIQKLQKENIRLSRVNDLSDSENNPLKINKELKISNKNYEIVEKNLKIQLSHLKYLNVQLMDSYHLQMSSIDDLHGNIMINSTEDHVNKSLKLKQEHNELFTLWVSDDHTLPEIQHLSILSMMLTGHNVTLYTYEDLENVPEGVEIKDANRIIDESDIFTYKEGFNKGSYSGFANVFRYKCLYLTPKSWFDCDILAIKNINDIYPLGNIISSQYSPDKTIYPNNGFLRLPQGDKFLKALINAVSSMDLENVKHGETGPMLLKSMIDTKYQEYYKYLVDPNFISPINYFDYEDYLKPTKQLVPTLNLQEIWGFHIWNAMFRENGHQNEETYGGFYHDLKRIILSSQDQEQYTEQIKNFLKI